MAKDFFDEEYEKKSQQDEQKQQAFDSWYNHPAPASEKNRKPLYIVLTCFVLIACIGLGWLLCYMVDELTTPEEEKILGKVIEYLNNNYYEDVTNWTDAIEYSGTALMQYAGDRFSMLMSPQTYYDFNNPTASSSTANEDGYFGVSFYIEEGIGLYVSSVTADTYAYGNLFEGDIVLQLTNMKDKNGNTPTVDKKRFSQINFSQWARTTIEEVLDETKSATFHVLRLVNDEDGSHYTIKEIPLTRTVIIPVNTNYDFQFIEFYFNDTDRNISIPSDKKDTTIKSTFTVRELQNLPKDTGYVRIKEFMDYNKTNSRGQILTDSKGNAIKVSAADEFKEVMKLFRKLGLKHLVLDLKGNPGGNVSYVTEIAGMLVTNAKLSNADKTKVMGSGDNANKLLITYLEMPKPAKVRQNYYQASSYETYFGQINQNSACDIVVWTDSGSASASELLTGALRDYGTAVQMGTTTYGKGIAQTWQELPFTGKVKTLDKEVIDYHWAIYYTCAKYYPPISDNIHGVGYTPDDQYNNKITYADLWDAALSYWNV